MRCALTLCLVLLGCGASRPHTSTGCPDGRATCTAESDTLAADDARDEPPFEASPEPTSCPEGQRLCPVNGGVRMRGAPSTACTTPCDPGESFGAGIGHCTSEGCPVYYLP